MLIDVHEDGLTHQVPRCAVQTTVDRLRATLPGPVQTTARPTPSGGAALCWRGSRTRCRWRRSEHLISGHFRPFIVHFVLFGSSPVPQGCGVRHHMMMAAATLAHQDQSQPLVHAHIVPLLHCTVHM